MGTIKRWMVLGGEEAIACVIVWRIAVNGLFAVGEMLV